MLIAFTMSPAGQVGHPDAPEAEATKEQLVVDADRSIVQWKGTKFWGTRKHEGVVRLAEGSVITHEGAIVAGRFVLDMTTIEVTDIPKSDPIPDGGFASI